MGRISPGLTRWPPGAERRLVPAKSNLKSQTSDVLALGVLAGSPEYRVYDGLMKAVAWGGEVPEGFDSELGPGLL